jgi:hypothetical protein
MAAYWLSIPLALLFVFTAAIQRTGLVADTDEASWNDRVLAISTAKEAINEAKAQLVKDQAAIDTNCKIWGPICTQAKEDRRATEKKLAENRAIILKGATVIDDSMAKRIVAFANAIGWTSLTKEKVELYHPMLLPTLLGLLGSLCITIGVHRGKSMTSTDAERAAVDILALINSTQRSPTKEEIAAIIAGKTLREKIRSRIVGWITRFWDLARPIWRRLKETTKSKTADEPKSESIAEPPKPPQRQAKPRLVTAEPYKADIHHIMKAALATAEGERTDLGACLLRYQAEGGTAPMAEPQRGDEPWLVEGQRGVASIPLVGQRPRSPPSSPTSPFVAPSVYGNTAPVTHGVA